MKKFGYKALIFILTLCISMPVLPATAADTGAEISMSLIGAANAGETVKLKIEVSPKTALAGIEFSLSFDSNYLTPQITQNGEAAEMDQLVTSLPSGWEQLSGFSASESKYYFRFAIPESHDVFLHKDGELVLEVPFKITASGVFDFVIADGDIIAIDGESLLPLSGIGDTLSISAASENEKFLIELGENDLSAQNGIYYLNIEISNSGDDKGIIGLEFALKYDESCFKPFITENDAGQMDSFMISTPQNGWEQLCTLYENQSRLILRFAANHAESLTESEILARGKSMKISVPFYVIGSSGQSADFNVNSATVIGINNANENIIGRGDKKTVSVNGNQGAIPPVYEIKDGHLLYAAEKTSISEFLSIMPGFYVSQEGKRVEDGYVKTGQLLEDGNGTSLIIVVKGDVNGNGEIDSRDYIFTKRSYFKTYMPNKTELFAMATVNGESVTARDYLNIKRHYFGTYDING